MTAIRNCLLFSCFLLVCGCADLRTAKLAYEQGNYEAAEQHWHTLAERGFPRAKYGMGLLAEKVKQAPEQAIDFYLEAYNRGYLPAAASIGRYYFNRGEWEKARHWLEKAKQQGNLSARLLLADMQLQGLGMAPAPKAALATYRELAEAGIAGASKRLAKLYEQGQWVSQNPAKAFQYYQQALTQGDPTAELALARLYAEGFGVTQNIAKAMNIYRHHAQQGNLNAAYALARLLEQSTEPAPPPEEAFRWYQTAAEKGHLQARLKWAELLLKGKGIPQDLQKAIGVLEQLSGQGVAKASRLLGMVYLKGNGLGIDFQKARRYLELAVKQGDFEAGLSLAVIYEEGLGIPRDLQKAESLYLEQANSGDPKAFLALGQYYERRWQASQSASHLDKAIRWCRQAALAQTPKAPFHLAQLLEIAGEKKEAQHWAEKALASGDQEALLYFGNLNFQQAKRAVEKIQALSWILTAARLNTPGAVMSAWQKMQQMTSPEQIEEANQASRQLLLQLQTSKHLDDTSHSQNQR